MHAVIPAAGKGTRLRPHTAGRPKGLVDVAGRSVLTHCFEQVLELPIDEIVMIVGCKGNLYRLIISWWMPEEPVQDDSESNDSCNSQRDCPCFHQ